MKILCMKGGLGNQLFEYCRYRNLLEAESAGVFFYYDRRRLKQHGHQKLSDCFDMELPNTPLWVAPMVWLLKAMRFLHVWPRLYDDERADCLLIDDYCQDKRFIQNATQYLVFRKFTFSTSYQDYLERIRASAHSVSVHIRRGDYLYGQNINNFGLCDMDYYQKAIKHVTERYPNATFFIFSDDIAWSKNHLACNNACFIEHKSDEPDYFDLYLMAQCHSHIIANSTFSFWGARLSQRDVNGIRIRPRHWFKNPTWHTPDIFPSEWIAI